MTLTVRSFTTYVRGVYMRLFKLSIITLFCARFYIICMYAFIQMNIQYIILEHCPRIIYIYDAVACISPFSVRPFYEITKWDDLQISELQISDLRSPNLRFRSPIYDLQIYDLQIYDLDLQISDLRSQNLRSTISKSPISKSMISISVH